MAASWRAQYSDGQSARSWRCEIRIEANGLMIDRGADFDHQIWPYSELRSPTVKTHGAEMIIEQRVSPGAQLLIRDGDAIERLRRIAPQLAASGSRRAILVPLIAIAGSIVALIALVWALNLQPARAIAGMLPDGVRQSIGRNVVDHFKTKGRVCDAPAGRRALDRLLARLLKREPNAALYSVTIIDLPFRNALATAGGQMIITSELIKHARAPDEVAGVLAHEIGHGIERHPDAGMVRLLGLSLLLEVFGGGSGMLSGISLQLLETGYRRQDEAAADQQALRLLRQAGISQKGLQHFFARDAEQRKESSSRALNMALDFLRTHPSSKERVAAVRRTPPYRSTPSLNPSEWQALRRICRDG
ncbi:MAG: M48 family metallopeptidase [Hyphomicrobiaceae bacterium]